MTLAAFLRHMAFALGLATVSALVVLAMMTAGVVDRPDPRKAHAQPTPKGGGVGVVVAFMLGVSVLYGYAAFARLADPYFRGVILAALAIAVVSYLDDLRDWPFVVKLAAQVAAALAAIGSGLYVQTFNLPRIGTVDIGWLGAVATLVWIIFATNAMNFMDGLNGLAAGTGLVACVFLAIIAETQGGLFVYAASVLLAAGLAGFLPFNFPRARIFLGDVGSQFCGFMLAVLGVAAARFDRVDLSFLLVPMLLGGILFDVAFTLCRRLLAGERVTQPHRGHLYQVAHRSGMKAETVAFVHWGFAAFGGACGLVFAAVGPEAKPLIPLVALAIQFAWLGYVARLAKRAAIGRW